MDELYLLGYKKARGIFQAPKPSLTAKRDPGEARRLLHWTNHPGWTMVELPEEGAGLALFRNAAAFLRSGAF